MSAGWVRRLQYAAACATLAAYAGLSHYCNSTPDAHALGAALALAPAAVMLTVLAWRATPPPVAILLMAGLAAVIIGIWPVLRQNFPLLALIEEGGVYGILGLTFARSLRPNHTAICTQLADKVHGPLSPREVRYTRRVTAAWAVFFFATSAASMILYLRAPLRVWSFYSNFCMLPLVGVMFVGEYLVRRIALPQVTRAGLLATLRVYLATPQ